MERKKEMGGLIQKELKIDVASGTVKTCRTVQILIVKL